MQHEFYHQYAADEHTLVCLEQLDKIWEAKEPPYKNYAPMFQGLERPGLLYLALLLHDVGKAARHEKGGHAEVGAEMAMRAAKRLQLDPAAAGTLGFLVENHLLMATLSQRRDLDDPSVIRNFARQVGTPEKLNLLALLTFADSQGTSDKLWSGFKDSLLWQLHSRAMTLLTGGTEFRRASAKARDELRDAVRELAPRASPTRKLRRISARCRRAILKSTRPRKFWTTWNWPTGSCTGLVLEDQRALAPVTAWLDEPDRGYSLVKICTWDRAGLFGKIAGSLSAAGLNILGAQIFTRADGIALDTFLSTTAAPAIWPRANSAKNLPTLLENVLTGEEVDLPALIARQTTTRPAYSAYLGERMEHANPFRQRRSDERTLIEIETEDRLGLLYAISQTFAELRLDISAARIVTERGAAIDSFYVREIDGGPIRQPARQVEVETALRSGDWPTGSVGVNRKPACHGCREFVKSGRRCGLA